MSNELGPSVITSPLPGIVQRVEVGPGDRVAEGDTVVVINSMKMEIPVTAEAAGTVQAVLVEEGQEVEADAPLLRLQ